MTLTTTHTTSLALGEDAAFSTTAYPLQGAIWPQAGISTELPPHFTITGPVGISLTDGGADFGPGGRLTTNSYYNLFNLGKWRKNCGELPLTLRLSGHGRFALSIRVASPNESTQQIVSETITLDGQFEQPISTDVYRHNTAVLYFSLTALDHGRLDDFAWVTTTPPRTIPELMLSVTTFRRETEVASTAARFRRYLAGSELGDHIRMVIVDNGGTVNIDDGDGITVIPNENLGGSGGFSRGLIAATGAGASHCLFMDDDASIQMEALSRTWSFLAYATDPKTAVAGGMINAAYRWQVWENGARFDLGCKAQYMGLDLRRREDVFSMEYETTAQAPDDFYGGWWFFAFPIAHVRHMPFPFFVRGDDVSFSLVHDFNIVTLPGVASIQESFVDKASPQVWYLDFRSHLAHHLSGAAKQHTWRELRGMIRSFYRRNVLRLHYDSLAAVNLALEDVMKGPDFFDENVDMAKRRADLKEMTTTETWQPLTETPRVHVRQLPRPIRALWLATLNGHLVPFGSRLGAALTLSAPFREDFPKAYGAKQITYLNSDGTSAYVVRRDNRRFWKESLRLLKNSSRLRRNYSAIQKEWHEGYARMTSNEYWTRKLRLDQGSE